MASGLIMLCGEYYHNRIKKINVIKKSFSNNQIPAQLVSNLLIYKWKNILFEY